MKLTMGLFNRTTDETETTNTSTFTEDFLTIDPDLGRRPVLPAGDYEGVLDRTDIRPSRFAEGKNAAHFEVVVRHAEYGIIRLFADKDLVAGTIAPKWYRQLGISDDEMRSGFSPAKLAGTNVLVTVGIRQYEKDGEQVQTNTIRNIVKL